MPCPYGGDKSLWAGSPTALKVADRLNKPAPLKYNKAFNLHS